MRNSESDTVHPLYRRALGVTREMAFWDEYQAAWRASPGGLFLLEPDGREYVPARSFPSLYDRIPASIDENIDLFLYQGVQSVILSRCPMCDALTMVMIVALGADDSAFLGVFHMPDVIHHAIYTNEGPGHAHA